MSCPRSREGTIFVALDWTCELDDDEGNAHPSKALHTLIWDTPKAAAISAGLCPGLEPCPGQKINRGGMGL